VLSKVTGHVFKYSACTCKLYADDLQLYTMLDTNKECNDVQDAIQIILLTECYVCTLVSSLETDLNDVALPVVDEAWDFVIIESRLMFYTRILKLTV